MRLFEGTRRAQKTLASPWTLCHPARSYSFVCLRWDRFCPCNVGIWLKTRHISSVACRRRKSLFGSRGFFDHLLRNDESYGAKWRYVRDNPVRHGLVSSFEEWPYQGEIVHIDRVGSGERVARRFRIIAVDTTASTF